MSIYDKASLVLIPSGTKTSKVYSQVPTNGDGDFTFSRSTAATRVNASGNIEKETQNLLTYSNGFNSWGQTGVSVTSGQSGYDGSSDAWLLTTSAVAGYINRAVVNSGVQTYSIYAKAGTETGLFIRLNGGSNPRCFFDLTNGLVGSDSGGVIKSSIEDVGGGWYRCSIACNDTSTDARVYVASSGGSFPSTGNIYIQDAQLEQGLVARDYIETTTTAIYGGITDNVPRLDYTDSSCPSLLLEPQRTNLMPYSEYFGAWTTQAGITLTPNTDETTSPEGLNNAYKVVSTNASNGFYYGGLNSTAESIRSIYLKGALGGETLVLKDPSGYGTSTSVTLTTEWQRFTHSTSNTGQNYQGLWIDDISVGTIYAYGAQWEEGSYATSYIPTYGSAVTRNQDFCKNAAPELGDSQGTLFLEYNALDNYADAYSYFALSDKTYNNRIAIINSIGGTNQVRAFAFVGGVRYFDFFVSVTDITSNTKVAVTYKENDFAIYVNGVKEATDTSGSVFPNGTLNDVSFTEVGNNASPFTGEIRQALVFPTALTDQEAIDLTTL
jgi:hypothetical protein